MRAMPPFHFHLKGGDEVRPTFTNFKTPPNGGIFQTQCPHCGNWGFVFSQRDRGAASYRIIGQGHSRASRALNNLPIYGVLLMRTKKGKFFYDSEHSYVKTLYMRGDKVLRETSLYSNYAVVPVFRDDYQIIDAVNESTEAHRIRVFAKTVAPLYVGVTTSEFQLRLDAHLNQLVTGFTDLVATIPRINLAGVLS